MKKAIVLLLIFIGYQFIVSLIFIALNMIQGEMEPLQMSGNVLGLSSLVSGLMMVAHLIYCRDVKFGRHSFFEVPVRYLLFCLPLVLSAMYFLNVLTEVFRLPNWGEEAFLAMSRNFFGVVSMVIVAPFTEELLFRGAIEGHFLKQGKSPVFAIVVSSLFFGIIHGNPAQMPFAFLIGLLLGWLFYRTGSVVPGFICHVINNGIAVITMTCYPQESNAETNGTSEILSMVLAAAIFAVSFYYARKYFPRHLWPYSQS